MIKLNAPSLLVLLFLLAGIVVNSQADMTLAQASQDALPLRLSEPVEAVVADLEAFIPEYMREQNIPGVGIALIRDGEVVWTEGFGVANAFTREAVSHLIRYLRWLPTAKW